MNPRPLSSFPADRQSYLARSVPREFLAPQPLVVDQPAPHLEIDAPKSENAVLYRVRDNKMGIESRFHGKIFGLFDTLDAAAEEYRLIEGGWGMVWEHRKGRQ